MRLLASVGFSNHSLRNQIMEVLFLSRLPNLSTSNIQGQQLEPASGQDDWNNHQTWRQVESNFLANNYIFALFVNQWHAPISRSIRSRLIVFRYSNFFWQIIIYLHFLSGLSVRRRSGLWRTTLKITSWGGGNRASRWRLLKIKNWIFCCKIWIRRKAFAEKVRHPWLPPEMLLLQSLSWWSWVTESLSIFLSHKVKPVPPKK